VGSRRGFGSSGCVSGGGGVKEGETNETITIDRRDPLLLPGGWLQLRNGILLTPGCWSTFGRGVDQTTLEKEHMKTGAGGRQ